MLYHGAYRLWCFMFARCKTIFWKKLLSIRAKNKKKRKTNVPLFCHHIFDIRHVHPISNMFSLLGVLSFIRSQLLKSIWFYLSVYSFIPYPQKEIIKGIYIGLNPKKAWWLPSDYLLSIPVHTFLATFCIQTIPLDTFCIQYHLEQYVSVSKK